MAVAVYLVELLAMATVIVLLTMLATVLIVFEKILYGLLIITQPTILLLDLFLVMFEDGFLYAVNSFSSIMHIDDVKNNVTISESL